MTESNTKLNDYKNQVVELRSALASGGLSMDESRQKREQLLSIQESLVGMYGREAEGIDLVSGNVDYLIERLDALAEAQWRTWEVEHTESGAIPGVVDRFTNVQEAEIEGLNKTDIWGVRNLPLPSKSDLEKGIEEMNLSSVPETFYQELQSEFDKAGLKIDAIDAMSHGLAKADFGDISSIYELQDAYQQVYDIVDNVGANGSELKRKHILEILLMRSKDRLVQFQILLLRTKRLSIHTLRAFWTQTNPTRRSGVLPWMLSKNIMKRT